MKNNNSILNRFEEKKQDWRQTILKYQNPDLFRSWWQMINSVGFYIILWILMVQSLKISYLLTLLLSVVAAGLMVRSFIIFHDCGHGSFFKSQKANNILGIVTGILTFTPYLHWTASHAAHHNTAGNLDRRGTGDVWTMTVLEYMKSSRWKRFSYRLYRNPFVMFILGPIYIFLIGNRFAIGALTKKEKLDVYFTNAALIGIIIIVSLVIGFENYLKIQFPILMMATTGGVWLFYIQHNYENVNWERQKNWAWSAAALEGSSFYKLPKILQWFSGNIGFHHIHHLRPNIPNYNLPKCHKEHSVFQEIKPITLLSSLKSLSLRLWNEETNELVSYRQVRLSQKK